MIGKIILGKSFAGCLNYCLNDKQQQAQKEAVMKDRAEPLVYNFCGGNRQELVQQFTELAQLNSGLSKPVMHITLSLSPEDQLPKDKLMELCRDCARELGFDQHQYLGIYHKDTSYQHLHLVVNRVGYDKRTLSDSNNYKKMAAYCRKMESKYGLKQVLSPAAFLSKEQRLQPRQNSRQAELRQAIQQCLLKAGNFHQFEEQMTALGYHLQKGRGIAFTDDKNVRTKGSEVGFPLAKIEKILELKRQLSLQEKQALLQKPRPVQKQQAGRQVSARPAGVNTGERSLPGDGLYNEVSRLIYQLVKPEHPDTQELPDWLQLQKKRKRWSQHL